MFLIFLLVPFLRGRENTGGILIREGCLSSERVRTRSGGFLPSNSTGPAKLECLDWKRLGIMPGDIEEYNLDTSQKRRHKKQRRFLLSTDRIEALKLMRCPER